MGRHFALLFDGPILGNGLLGVVCHRQAPERGDNHPNTLLFAINRNDAVDLGYFQAEGYVWQRFGVGKIALQIDANIVRVQAHLDTQSAVLEATIETDSGSLEVRAWVHATQPVFWLEVRGETGYDVRFVPDPSGPILENGRVDIEESATYQPLNPPAQIETRDGILCHRQTLHCSEREWVLALGEDSQGATRCFAAALDYSHPQRGERFDAVEMVQIALNKGGWEESHRNWWRDWNASAARIELPGAPEVAVFAARQNYVLGCIARGDGPMIDLNGPWWCHTVWRAVWWNLNAQCTYLPLIAANRLDLLHPLQETLWRNRENLRRNAPRQWQHDSFALGRASGYDCYSPLDLSVAPDAHPRELGNLETGNLLWALHPLYLGWTHSASDESDHEAREILFPLLKGAVNLYFHLLRPGDDGHWHLPPTFSPELLAAPDCAYDLSLLCWGLQSLLELNARLQINDNQALVWSESLQLLAPLRVGESGVLIGQGAPLEASHRHFSHLLEFWPLKILPLKTVEQRDLLERSLRHWLGMPQALAGYSHAAGAALWAQLGQGEEAALCLSKLISGGVLSKTTLYREAGLCLETPLLGLAALHEMLLQVLEGVILPFPAIPQSWGDVSFENLRAEGALLVSAWRRDGEVGSLLVQNDGARTAFCRVHLPPAQWQSEVQMAATSREGGVELSFVPATWTGRSATESQLAGLSWLAQARRKTPRNPPASTSEGAAVTLQ